VALTPSQHTPLLRRSEVFRLADRFRKEFSDLRIEDIAERFEIKLLYTDGPESAPDGVAILQPFTRPLAVSSLVSPNDRVRVWGGVEHAIERVVLIRRNSLLPLREIWWHEFYHILFSPRSAATTMIVFNGANHEYRVEERRADDFAAAMLVPSLEGLTSLDDVIERYSISKRLAQHAMELHAALVGYSDRMRLTA
jgi:hypothetical protein